MEFAVCSHSLDELQVTPFIIDSKSYVEKKHLESLLAL